MVTKLKTTKAKESSVKKKKTPSATGKLKKTKKIEKLLKSTGLNKIKLPQKKTIKVGKKRIGLKLFVWIISLIVITVILFLVVLGVGIYRYDWNNKTTEWVSKIVPYPAAFVDYKLVTFHEYRKEIDSTKHYQSKLQGINFESEDAKSQLEQLEKDILEQLVNNVIIEKKANDFDISISKEEVTAEYDKIVEANGGEEKVKEILDDYYMWSTKEFKEKIKVYLTTQKLQEKVAQDDEINKKQKAKAEDILKQIKDGSDFEKLAKKYSEDKTNASDGGSLGLISKGQKNDSDLDEAVFSLKKGKISDVVKVKNGYAIVKVGEIKGEKRRARYILIKYQDFTEWMDQQKEEASIYRYVAK